MPVRVGAGKSARVEEDEEESLFLPSVRLGFRSQELHDRLADVLRQVRPVVVRELAELVLQPRDVLRKPSCGS